VLGDPVTAAVAVTAQSQALLFLGTRSAKNIVNSTDLPITISKSIAAPKLTISTRKSNNYNIPSLP
jgi:hypothetical protein